MPTTRKQTAQQKLPKFLQKAATRDRTKSMSLHEAADALIAPSNDPTISTSSLASTASSPLPMPASRRQPQLSGVSERFDEDSPVIVEPPTTPRHQSPTGISAPSRVPGTDLPARLSGWFTHAFSSSATDLSLPTLLANASSPSRRVSGGSSSSSAGTGATALLSAAKTGKSHLDKIARFITDSDATPDRCPDPIWLLGVQHPGYEPPPPPSAMPPIVNPASSGSGSTMKLGGSTHRRASIDSLIRRRRGDSSSPVSPITPIEFSQSQPGPGSFPSAVTAKEAKPNPASNWPPAFYADFTSRVWLTYRKEFLPIRDGTLAGLQEDLGEELGSPTGTGQGRRWHFLGLGGEKTWSSDAGWGCMLRTGQSLLANSLVHLHLGRDWRRPPYATPTPSYATYVRIITWFLDTPAPEAPFSVHRMALAGKDLGTDVGQWFGPSIAAGAIKTLAHAFPECGLGVCTAVDSVVYQSDVLAASHGRVGGMGGGKNRYHEWGNKAVLVLVGIRLGINGVNPVYYEAVKTLFTFPQSVGISGGRPSSSYYFVGVQADNLFYLDPHYSRPAVPLRTLPPSNILHRHDTPDNDASSSSAGSHNSPGRTPASPPRASPPPRGSASVFATRRGANSPSPLHQQQHPRPELPRTSSRTSNSSASSRGRSSNARVNTAVPVPPLPRDGSGSGSHSRWPTSPALDTRELANSNLDSEQEHLVNAYSAAELRTFHCDRVRKMPLSGLDPSMLLGFLCRDEADWVDLGKRIADLSKTHKTIFTIQDEPPVWPNGSDDNIGLESMSDEFDMEMPEDEEEEDDGQSGEEENEERELFDRRSLSTSPDTSVKGKGSEVDTEEDLLGPVTPGPHPRSGVKVNVARGGKDHGDEFNDLDEDDEDDEWVDSMHTPTPPPVSPPSSPPPAGTTTRTPSRAATTKKSKKTESRHQAPAQHFPFPSSSSPGSSPSRHSQSSGARSPSPGEWTGMTSAAVPRMHTARARDGGRTQSGGVRGVPADDADTF